MFGALPRLLILAAGAVALVVFASEDFFRADPDSDDDSDDTDQDQNNSLADTLAGTGPFGTFHVAARSAGLLEILEEDGPYTVFAPTDEAFGKMGERFDELLVKPKELAELLKHHIVEGEYNVDALSEDQSLKTLAGGKISVTGGVSPNIDEAKLVEPDVTATNGTIQGIDDVLTAPVPKKSKAKSKSTKKKKSTKKS
jgi:uncharacterized surface protein with fasciclin (FAS1) repeats